MPGSSGSGTCSGTAEGGRAARHGGRDAELRVLDRDAVGGIDAERLRGAQVRFGIRLAVDDLVARDDDVEGGESGGLGDVVGHPADRHGHQGGRHAGVLQGHQQLARPGAPRHLVGELGDHAIGQHLDDLAADPAARRASAMISDERSSDDPTSGKAVLAGPGRLPRRAPARSRR